MRYIILSVFLFASYFGSAQTSLNDYKYMVVPKRLSEFKKENQYQTSTLIKYLLTKKGFAVVYDDALPGDVANSRCKALFVSLQDVSSMFNTKTTVVFKDCNGKEIFATHEGKSKKKEYRSSYSEAITDAMTSLNGLNYKYNGKYESNEPITVSFKNDVKRIENKEVSVKAKNVDTNVIVQEATREEQTFKSKEPKESTVYVAANKNAPTVAQDLPLNKSESVSADINKPEVNKVLSKVLANEVGNTLYAQELPNGYQLVDSAPKIQLRILKTSMPNYYLAEGGEKNGVVYSKNGKWYFEYYTNDELIVKELNIKF